MAEKRYRWVGKLGFSIGRHGDILVVGRTVATPTSDAYRRDLMKLGVFAVRASGEFYYSGAITMLKKDGTKYSVDQDGFCSIDLDELPGKTRAGLSADLEEPDAPKGK